MNAMVSAFISRKAYMNTINIMGKMPLDDAVKQGFDNAVKAVQGDFPLTSYQKASLYKKHVRTCHKLLSK